MSDKARRKLLKTIVSGGGVIVAGKSLPESWTKPVVDSVMLPAHAETSPAEPTPCTPCLVAETYCAGRSSGAGDGSIDISVATNGTVTVVHPQFTDTDTVDPCTGGTFQVIYDTMGNQGQITVSGSIPCGVTSSININETDGQGNDDDLVATTATCNT
jgi:hypothetical protein